MMETAVDDIVHGVQAALDMVDWTRLDAAAAMFKHLELHLSLNAWFMRSEVKERCLALLANAAETRISARARREIQNVQISLWHGMYQISLRERNKLIHP